MNKPCFQRVATALAISFFATGAFADIEFYGKANVSFQNSDDGTDSTTEVRSNASRVGVKGFEDLDDNLKAVFQLEFESSPDDGEASGQTFGQRNIFVGLQGNFGLVKAGKFDSPFKEAQNKIDLFNDMNGDIATMITVNDNRPSNVVAYVSPESLPVTVYVAYISSEDPEVDNGVSASLSFTTLNDSLYLAVAMDQDVEAEGAEAVRGVVQYTLGAWQFGGLVEESDNGVESESGYLGSVQYSMDKWALKAQYGTSDIVQTGGESLSLGADYKLGKPVKLFGFVTTLESDEGADEAYTGVGIEYKF